MLPNLQDLGVYQLSPEERLELIGQIWDSLDPNNLPEIPASHKEELDRRIEEADASPGGDIEWREALARLRSKP